jgi:hypothetical protein
VDKEDEIVARIYNLIDNVKEHSGDLNSEIEVPQPPQNL